MTVLERIEAKIEAEPNTGCWLWTGAMTGNGYSNVWWDGKVHLVHRVMYEMHVGPIPEGLQIDHLCRVRSCVNPDHLEPVTQTENLLRGVSLSAENARKTHCKYGHEFTEANTRRVRGGGRHCRECKRRRDREAYHKRKVAA